MGSHQRVRAPVGRQSRLRPATPDPQILRVGGRALASEPVEQEGVTASEEALKSEGQIVVLLRALEGLAGLASTHRARLRSVRMRFLGGPPDTDEAEERPAPGSIVEGMGEAIGRLAAALDGIATEILRLEEAL